MSIYRCKIRVSIEVFEVPRHQNQAQINAFYHNVSRMTMCDGAKLYIICHNNESSYLKLVLFLVVSLQIKCIKHKLFLISLIQYIEKFTVI